MNVDAHGQSYISGEIESSGGSMMKLSSPGEAFPTDNETEASAALTTKVNFQCLKSFFVLVSA